MNTDESDLVLLRAETRVLGIQTKLHRWARDDPDRRFDDLFEHRDRGVLALEVPWRGNQRSPRGVLAEAASFPVR